MNLSSGIGGPLSQAERIKSTDMAKNLYFIIFIQSIIQSSVNSPLFDWSIDGFESMSRLRKAFIIFIFYFLIACFSSSSCLLQKEFSSHVRINFDNQTDLSYQGLHRSPVGLFLHLLFSDLCHSNRHLRYSDFFF